MFKPHIYVHILKQMKLPMFIHCLIKTKCKQKTFKCLHFIFVIFKLKIARGPNKTKTLVFQFALDVKWSMFMHRAASHTAATACDLTQSPEEMLSALLQNDWRWASAAPHSAWHSQLQLNMKSKTLLIKSIKVTVCFSFYTVLDHFK